MLPTARRCGTWGLPSELQLLPYSHLTELSIASELPCTAPLDGNKYPLPHSLHTLSLISTSGVTLHSHTLPPRLTSLTLGIVNSSSLSVGGSTVADVAAPLVLLTIEQWYRSGSAAMQTATAVMESMDAVTVRSRTARIARHSLSVQPSTACPIAAAARTYLRWRVQSVH